MSLFPMTHVAHRLLRFPSWFFVLMCFNGSVSLKQTTYPCAWGLENVQGSEFVPTESKSILWRGPLWEFCKIHLDMEWLRLVGSLKLHPSFAEYSLFYRAFFATETYNFKEATNRSHPIFWNGLRCNHFCGPQNFRKKQALISKAACAAQLNSTEPAEFEKYIDEFLNGHRRSLLIGLIWNRLLIMGLIWNRLLIMGLIWNRLLIIGLIWNRLLIIGLIWNRLLIIGLIWNRLLIIGLISNILLIIGLIWNRLLIMGLIWNRFYKNCRSWYST